MLVIILNLNLKIDFFCTGTANKNKSHCNVCAMIAVTYRRGRIRSLSEDQHLSFRLWSRKSCDLPDVVLVVGLVVVGLPC